MALQFTLDSVTGVYKPPVTVMNGGTAAHYSKRSVKNRAVTVFNGGKRKTKRKTTRKTKRKTTRKTKRKTRKTRKH